MAAVIAVTARGVEPGILMSNPASMLVDDAEPGGARPAQPAESRKAVAERLAYRMPDGALGFPSAAFQRAGIDGGKGQQVALKSARPGEREGKKISVQTFLAGLWEVEPKGLVAFSRNGKPIRDYIPDVRTGRNRNAKNLPRIVLIRPLVQVPWEVRFDIVWDDVGGDARTPDLIRQCLERAGRQIGIGAFRPMVDGKPTGGWFGRFEIVSWEAR